jgi:hypothetical protein
MRFIKNKTIKNKTIKSKGKVPENLTLSLINGKNIIEIIKLMDKFIILFMLMWAKTDNKIGNTLAKPIKIAK